MRRDVVTVDAICAAYLDALADMPIGGD